MNRIVITCHANGSVETLLKDQAFDTRKLGDRKIERITVIEHDDVKQAFYIKWLKGPFAGQLHTLSVAFQIVGRMRPLPAAENIVMQYDTYEQAVKDEIDYVNELRLQGHSFA